MAHSPTLLSLIFQALSHFTYTTAHSPTLPSLLLRHRIFTYVSWRASHAIWLSSEADLSAEHLSTGLGADWGREAGMFCIIFVILSFFFLLFLIIALKAWQKLWNYFKVWATIENTIFKNTTTNLQSVSEAEFYNQLPPRILVEKLERIEIHNWI